MEPCQGITGRSRPRSQLFRIGYVWPRHPDLAERCTASGEGRSGGARPGAGSGRGVGTLVFSRRRGGVATQRPAKPSTPVRFRSSPLAISREMGICGNRSLSAFAPEAGHEIVYPRALPQVGQDVVARFPGADVRGTVVAVDPGQRGLVVVTEEDEVIRFLLQERTGRFHSGGQSGARLYFTEAQSLR
jgi:hypothetical protein